MPASRARVRPAASARFEITTAILASRRPVAMAWMIACRFDPRPEIRTAIRGVRRSVWGAGWVSSGGIVQLHVADRAIAGDDESEPEGVRLARPRQHIDRAFGVARAAHDNEPHTHVECAKHLVAGDLAAFLQQTE